MREYILADCIGLSIPDASTVLLQRDVKLSGIIAPHARTGEVYPELSFNIDTRSNGGFTVV